VPVLLPGFVFGLSTAVVPGLINGLGDDVVDIFSRNLLLGMLNVDHFPWIKLKIDASVKQLK